jgi:hypothetical protein
MVEQAAQAIHNCKPETEAAAAIRLGRRELAQNSPQMLRR